MTPTLLLARTNLRWNIPDKAFAISDNLVLQIVGELNLLPLLVIACRLCPKSVEGTMYALIMSSINLGALIGGQIGGLLTYALDVGAHNYENLWLLVLITSLMGVLPLTYINLVDLDKAKSLT